MSDMSSLLNMAALRSRTEGLLACQLGSSVDWDGDCGGERLKVVVSELGEANGELGRLAGCVTKMLLSRCEIPPALLSGGDPALLMLSAAIKEKINLVMRPKYTLKDGGKCGERESWCPSR